MPPCPGSKLPESLTSAARFIADSKRSPNWLKILVAAARRTINGTEPLLSVRCVEISPPYKMPTGPQHQSCQLPIKYGVLMCTHVTPRATAAISDATAPSQVLPGLIRGA